MTIPSQSHHIRPSDIKPFYFWGRSNYEITTLRAYRGHWLGRQLEIMKLHDYELTDAFLFLRKVKLRNYNITSLQRPLTWETARDNEIAWLWADRCLFISGEGQITKLQDYEFTEATDLGASSRLRNYEITSWQMPFYFWGRSNYEITRLRAYREQFLLVNWIFRNYFYLAKQVFCKKKITLKLPALKSKISPEPCFAYLSLI